MTSHQSEKPGEPMYDAEDAENVEEWKRMRSEKPPSGVEAMPMRWAVMWRSVNLLDGIIRHWIWDAGRPVLFRSRRDAREWIEERYGYIRQRPDLRAEPHGWKMPEPVKVEVILRATR